MNLEKIESLIERENINLIDTVLEDTSGAFVNYDKLNLILYDRKQIYNSTEKNKYFLKNYGHYYYDATYKFDSNLQLVSKQEYRAKKWSYNVLIPFEKLKSAILKRN